MTPDVSSVMAILADVKCAHHATDKRTEDSDELWQHRWIAPVCLTNRYEALQQAAEQACYRYALRVLEQIAIGVSGTTWATALGKLDGWADAVEGERDRIRQLLAGSA